MSRDITAPRKHTELDASDETNAAGLTKSDCDRLRVLLEQEKARVLASLPRHIENAVEDDSPLADEMDLATRDQEQAFLLRLADKERKLLMELNRALAKFEDGTFGLCEGTGEPIGLRRLEARPWARYSVAYKEQLEREERGRPRF